MSSLDLESLAIKVAINTEEFLKECNVESSKARALSRRARELPSLIQQAGLFQATVFYLSKIEDEDVYREAYKAIAGKGGEEKVCRSVREEVTGEGKGYAFLLAVLSYAISEYSKISGDDKKECNDLSSKVNVAKCLLALRESGLLLAVERALTPYVLTIKRLFEALFPG